MSPTVSRRRRNDPAARAQPARGPGEVAEAADLRSGLAEAQPPGAGHGPRSPRGCAPRCARHPRARGWPRRAARSRSPATRCRAPATAHGSSAARRRVPRPPRAEWAVPPPEPLQEPQPARLRELAQLVVDRLADPGQVGRMAGAIGVRDALAAVGDGIGGAAIRDGLEDESPLSSTRSPISRKTAASSPLERSRGFSTREA